MGNKKVEKQMIRNSGHDVGVRSGVLSIQMSVENVRNNGWHILIDERPDSLMCFRNLRKENGMYGIGGG